MKYGFVFFLLLWCLCSCQKAVDIPNFDEKAFRQDTKGCSGIRKKMKDELFDIRDALKGLSADQVQATLGNPDQEDLADRNQKYFIYFIEPSSECQHPETGKKPLTMYVRFSALNYATEISFKNY